MHLNGAAHSFGTQATARRGTSLALQTSPIKIDREIVERAAEALFEFVFSGCDRLDGKHRWADCDENTKAGFRAEVTAVLAAAWPSLAFSPELRRRPASPAWARRIR
jgi:hypothetical protein